MFTQNRIPANEFETSCSVTQRMVSGAAKGLRHWLLRRQEIMKVLSILNSLIKVMDTSTFTFDIILQSINIS